MNATVKNVRARGRELKAAMVCAATVWFAASAGAQVTFEDVTGTMGLGGSGSWVDIDSDGWVDLAPGWRNEHGTKFVKTGVGGGGGAWADMDNDGCMDSFAPAGGGIGFSACEDKPHGLRLPDRPHRVSDGGTLIDIDNDGLIDVWWGGYENFPTVGGYPDGIYRNLGERSFKRLHVLGPARSSRGTTACDFDQDHDMDVYVTNYRLQPNQLWINDTIGGDGDHKGSFTESARAYGARGGNGHGIGSAWGDFDNDGLIDLFAGNFAHRGQPQSRFLGNRGPEHGFHFEDKGQCGVAFRESYGSPAFGDFDNDGDLDLFFTTVYPGDQAVLYRNDGNWRFTDVTGPAGLGGIRKTYHAAWADFDNDGDLDLATAGRLYRNSGTSNHWLKIKLIGNARTSAPQPGSVNRAAIGAQARIKLAGRTLTRQVESSTGRGNMNEQTLHFGLGDHDGGKGSPIAERVNIVITWPNGVEQTESSEVDRMITVRMSFAGEPQALPEAAGGDDLQAVRSSLDGLFTARAVEKADGKGSTLRVSRREPTAAEAAALAARPRGTWDLATDFSLDANPNGQWSYLYLTHHRKTADANPGTRALNPPDTSAAEPMTATRPHGTGNHNSMLDIWHIGAVDPYAYLGIVRTSQPSQAPYHVPFTVGEIFAHPGGEFRSGFRSTVVIARWTAPRDGEIVTVGTFRGSGDGDRDLYLLRNKTEVLVDEFSYRHTEYPFRFRLPVQAGDTLDLCVGRGVRIPSSIAKVEQAIYYAGYEPPKAPGEYLPVDHEHDVTIDTAEGESFTDPSWSPIGPELVCTGSRPGEARLDVWLINLKTGARRCLTAGRPGSSRRPVWAGDGNAVVYENDQSGEYRLYRLAR